MVTDCVARDTMVVAAVEGGREADMADSGLLPECGFFPPVGLGALAAGCPHLDADGGGITPGLFCQTVKFAEDIKRGLVWRVSVGHPAVAPFGDARQGVFMVPAVPKRYA